MQEGESRTGPTGTIARQANRGLAAAASWGTALECAEVKSSGFTIRMGSVPLVVVERSVEGTRDKRPQPHPPTVGLVTSQ